MKYSPSAAALRRTLFFLVIATLCLLPVGRSIGQVVVAVPATESFAAAKARVGGVPANTTFRLARGGSYGRVDLGNCPAGVSIEAAPGAGPLPIVGPVSAFAGGPSVPGPRFESLHIVAGGATGINLLNLTEQGGTGFRGTKIIGCEIEGADVGIANQTLNDAGRHANLLIDHDYIHDCLSLGILLGGVDGVTIRDSVVFSCGHSPGAMDQHQGIYGQAEHTRFAAAIGYRNVAVIDSTGANFRGTGAKFNGVGATLDGILSIQAGTLLASEAGLDEAKNMVLVEFRDPTWGMTPNDKNSGCGIHLQGAVGARLSRIVCGSLSTQCAGFNIHALQFDGCQGLAVTDVYVDGAAKGDCWCPSNEGAGAGTLTRMTFYQPAGLPFTNGDAPVSAFWAGTVAMTRMPVADRRASVASILTHNGAADLRALAAKLWATPGDIAATVAWVQTPYLGGAVTPPPPPKPIDPHMVWGWIGLAEQGGATKFSLDPAYLAGGPAWLSARTIAIDATGCAAVVQHLPFGAGALSTDAYSFTQAARMRSAGANYARLVDGYAAETKRVTDRGVRVVPYLGALQLSPELALSRDHTGDLLRLLAENLAPISEAGCKDLAIDSSVGLADGTWAYLFTRMLPARGITAWYESNPSINEPHIWDKPVIVDDRVYTPRMAMPQYAAVRLTGPVVRFVPCPNPGPGGNLTGAQWGAKWAAQSAPRVRAILADGHIPCVEALDLAMKWAPSEFVAVPLVTEWYRPSVDR